MITTDALPVASGKGRLITLWIVSGLVALVFVGAGGAKLAGAAAMVGLFAGYSHRWAGACPPRSYGTGTSAIKAPSR